MKLLLSIGASGEYQQLLRTSIEKIDSIINKWTPKVDERHKNLLVRLYNAIHLSDDPIEYTLGVALNGQFFEDSTPLYKELAAVYKGLGSRPASVQPVKATPPTPKGGALYGRLRYLWKNHHRQFNDFERKFVESVGKQLAAGKQLSQKQLAVAERILKTYKVPYDATANTFFSASFESSLQVAGAPYREVLVEKREMPLYDIHIKDIYWGSDDPVRMEVVFSKEGKYIGDIKTVEMLTNRYGITKFEAASPESRVCSIGYSPRDKKWYGWSHRAIFGFQVGDTIKPGDCAFRPKTIESWIQQQVEFWEADKWSYDPATKRFTYTKGDLTSFWDLTPDQLGNGEWEITTELEAKQAAKDFATSVSSEL